MAKAETIPAEVEKDKNGRNRLLVAIVGGHALKHLYLSAVNAIILPEIKIDMGLSATQLGALATTGQVSNWGTTMAAGYAGDRYSSKTALMLVISLALTGIAYFLVGISPTYSVLFGTLFLAGIGPSIYHPPALGALSRRFPDKRSFAVSLHGMGGSIGEASGPIVASTLLVLLSWRGVLQLSLVPALIGAFLMWRMIGSVRFDDSVGGSFFRYLGTVVHVLRNPAMAVIVLIVVLRTMGQSAITTFLPVYLREDLGYSAGTVGALLSLAQVVGIASQPVMGHLSDRFGFKWVLTPAMLALSVLLLVLFLVTGSVQIAVTIAALGAFLYSLHAIFVAAAMSVSGQDTQATVVSLIYGASFVGTVSPILGGLIADNFGTRTVFLYASVLVFLATFIFAVMRLPRVRARVGH